MCESNSNNISNEGESEQKLGKQAKKEREIFSVTFDSHENEGTMKGQEVRVQENITGSVSSCNFDSEWYVFWYNYQ